jgi:hypothetical protein
MLPKPRSCWSIQHRDRHAPFDTLTLVHEWFSLVEYQTTANKNILYQLSLFKPTSLLGCIVMFAF